MKKLLNTPVFRASNAIIVKMAGLFFIYEIGKGTNNFLHSWFFVCNYEVNYKVQTSHLTQKNSKYELNEIENIDHVVLKLDSYEILIGFNEGD